MWALALGFWSLYFEICVECLLLSTATAHYSLPTLTVFSPRQLSAALPQPDYENCCWDNQ